MGLRSAALYRRRRARISQINSTEDRGARKIEGPSNLAKLYQRTPTVIGRRSVVMPLWVPCR